MTRVIRSVSAVATHVDVCQIFIVAVFLTLFAHPVWAQAFKAFELTFPTEGAALVTGQDVTVKWSGGDPANSIGIALIDVSANAVAASWGSFPNTGSRVVTLPPLSQMTCAHTYRFYVENAERTAWTYGPLFVVTCGDQTSSGVITATAFVGDGSLLTGINAATANSANFATVAGSSNLAADAAALGGAPPSKYARVDMGNAFMGAQSIVGNITHSGNLATAGSVAIGDGTPITKHLSALVNPTFPALKPGACSVASVVFTGVADGDTLALGVPSSRLTGGGALQYFAWVSAIDVVSVRACNIDMNSPNKTPATGNIRIDVWKH
jgi:hypothetical protein